jgi:hypothetical protein
VTDAVLQNPKNVTDAFAARVAASDCRAIDSGEDYSGQQTVFS